jgi:hypothetical protein
MVSHGLNLSFLAGFGISCTLSRPNLHGAVFTHTDDLFEFITTVDKADLPNAVLVTLQSVFLLILFEYATRLIVNFLELSAIACLNIT